MPHIYCCNICFLTRATDYLNNSSSLWEMASSKSSSPTTLSLFPPSLQHQDTLSSFWSPFTIYPHYIISQALTSTLPRMTGIICLLKIQECTTMLSPVCSFPQKSLFEVHLCHDATNVDTSSQLSCVWTTSSFSNALYYLLNYKVGGGGGQGWSYYFVFVWNLIHLNMNAVQEFFFFLRKILMIIHVTISKNCNISTALILLSNTSFSAVFKFRF